MNAEQKRIWLSHVTELEWWENHRFHDRSFRHVCQEFTEDHVEGVHYRTCTPQAQAARRLRRARRARRPLWAGW